MEADSAPWRPQGPLYLGLHKIAHVTQALELILLEVLCDVRIEAPDLVPRLEWFHVVLVRAQGFLLERAAKLDADAAQGAGR